MDSGPFRGNGKTYYGSVRNRENDKVVTRHVGIFVLAGPSIKRITVHL